MTEFDHQHNGDKHTVIRFTNVATPDSTELAKHLREAAPGLIDAVFPVLKVFEEARLVYARALQDRLEALPVSCQRQATTLIRDLVAWRGGGVDFLHVSYSAERRALVLPAVQPPLDASITADLTLSKQAEELATRNLDSGDYVAFNLRLWRRLRT